MAQETRMSIERAVGLVLGDDLADAIIAENGIHWAVVAAMCDATTDDDPEAIAVIRAWKDEQVALSRLLSEAPHV